MRRPTLRSLLLLLPLTGGCADDPGGGPNGGGTLASSAGDGQTATVATALNPYQVRVTDENGAARAGVTVSWNVRSGGGSLSGQSSVSDAAGLAQVISTLGTTAGFQTVRAAVPGYQGSPVSFQSTGTAGAPALLSKVSGDNQAGAAAQALPLPASVRVADSYGNAVSGAIVTWTVAAGGGSVSAPTSVSGSTGVASINWTLGPQVGTNGLTASVGGGATASFTATAASAIVVLGGGNNVSERYTSDLWVADGYAYTGTWGFRGNFGNAVKIWRLGGSGAPTLVDSIITPNISTVSDIEVSPDGRWLVFTAEGGSNRGIRVYELTSPGTAVSRASRLNSNGLHTGALAVIANKLYAFAAQDPPGCALKIYDLSAAGSGTISEASTTPIPDNYCIHDSFVRDGYAFVFAWNEGLYIFDVGNGSHGGSPTQPVQISKTAGFGGETHNGWWFHNPSTNEKKYLFIGEEGPGSVGSSSSGDIHVVDVSNFAAPVEVASFRLPGAGTHNFWIDEPNQRLYAAYYNGGVVALDISGTLSGNLAGRKVAEIKPGGPGNTYVWGVMLHNGSLYASDMLSGLWQLSVP